MAPRTLLALIDEHREAEHDKLTAYGRLLGVEVPPLPDKNGNKKSKLENLPRMTFDDLKKLARNS